MTRKEGLWRPLWQSWQSVTNLTSVFSGAAARGYPTFRQCDSETESICSMIAVLP
jgi:hypothetical protein